MTIASSKRQDVAVRTSSLVQVTYERIRDLIDRAAENGDQCLPGERELAQRFGVSRPVIREATKLLQMRGLIEIRHGQGTRVVNKLHRPLNDSLTLLLPDENERLRQLVHTRQLLEPEVARLAATRIDASQIESLERCQANLRAADTPEDAVAADMEFHRVLASACGNQIFSLILDALAEAGRLSRERTIGRVGREPALAQHQRILAALVERKPLKARDAMAAHIAAASKDLGTT